MSAFFSAARTRAQSGGAVLDFFDAARQHSVALLRPGREAVPGIRIEHRDALPHPGEFPRQVADDGGFAYPTLPSPDRNNGHRLYFLSTTPTLWKQGIQRQMRVEERAWSMLAAAASPETRSKLEALLSIPESGHSAPGPMGRVAPVTRTRWPRP